MKPKSGEIVLPRPIREHAGARLAILPLSEPVPQWQRWQFERTVEYYERRGFRVTAQGAVGDHDSLSVASGRERAEMFMEAAGDPTTRLIVSANGGNDIDAILPYLDWEDIDLSSTHLVGYSNFTTLLLAALAHGWGSWHGPNGGLLLTKTDRRTRVNFWESIGGEKSETSVGFTPTEVLRSGSGRGLLVGGNLSEVCSLLGTPENPFVRIRRQPIILFWEEYKETFDDISRMLRQLGRAGVWDNCRGMVVGKLLGCDGAYAGLRTERDMRRQVGEIVSDWDFPVVWGVGGLGHDRGFKQMIPLGARGQLDTGAGELLIYNKLV